MGANREIKVSLIGDAASLERALEQGSRSLGKIEKHTNLATKAAAGFVAFQGAKAAASFLEDATKAAAADETAMSRAGLAVKNAGENWKRLKDPVDQALTKMSETSGFIKSDLVTNFSKLELATHDHTQALRLEKDAMNIAAQTGKPLAAITMALGKAYDGNGAALKRVGIIVPKVTKEQDKLLAAHARLIGSHKKLTTAQKIAYKDALDNAKADDRQATATSALDTAHKKFAGGVEARSETMAGKLAIFGAKWEGIKVRIGDVILPLIVAGLGDLMKAFDAVDGFVERNKTLVEILGGALAVLTGLVVIHEVAVKAAGVATKAWTVISEVATAAQWLWNASLYGFPVVLVVAGIVALIAAGVLLYEHVKVVRDIVNAAWGSIKTVASEVFGWFTDSGIPALKTAFGAASTTVETVVGNIKGFFDGIKTSFDGVVKFFRDLFNGDWGALWGDAKKVVSGMFDSIDSLMGGLPGRLGGKALDLIKTAASNIGSTIKNAVVGALDGLGSAVLSVVAGAINVGIVDPLNSLINTAVGLEKKIPGSPNLGIGKDPVPRIALAAGGIVTRPTVALIGEKGPEAVIPLGKGGLGAGVHIGNIDMRNTGGSPTAVLRRLSWEIRLASAGA